MGGGGEGERGGRVRDRKEGRGREGGENKGEGGRADRALDRGCPPRAGPS
jgi:hypothetical protein